MFYTGTISIFSVKYFILNDIVKKLKQESIPVGSIFNVTSEILCNKTVINKENVKPIFEHVPKHLRPVSDDQFWNSLAGLIDGEGHFSSKQQLVIVFHSSDAYLAYYIKERLGFGKVKKVKDKNAFLLIIASTEGLEKIVNLILNLSKDLKNHWLAGFSDADASFQIKVLHRSNIVEVRLNFQIDQKKDNILLLIKNFLGGNIGYISTQDTYYYGSTSFGSAKNVINYFDYFHLLSSKHNNYLKWRKVYLIIKNRDHLNRDGLEKIIKLKDTMNRLSNTAV